VLGESSDELISLCLCLVAWWNPALEGQAYDRIHRLAQRKEVFIHRCLVNGTVEENLIEIQKNKAHLASSALSDQRRRGGNERKVSASSLSLDALKQLFRSS